VDVILFSFPDKYMPPTLLRYRCYSSFSLSLSLFLFLSLFLILPSRFTRTDTRSRMFTQCGTTQAISSFLFFIAPSIIIQASHLRTHTLIHERNFSGLRSWLIKTQRADDATPGFSIYYQISLWVYKSINDVLV